MEPGSVVAPGPARSYRPRRGSACEGSPVLDDLRALETEGIEMLVCGTCLNYLELTDKLAVGQVSNMYDIAETMLRAGTVVHL